MKRLLSVPCKEDPPSIPPRYTLQQRLSNEVGSLVHAAIDHLNEDQMVVIKSLSARCVTLQSYFHEVRMIELISCVLPALTAPKLHHTFFTAESMHIVMDYIDGVTLMTFLRQKGGQLPPETVLDIGLQVSGLLHTLHTHSPAITHADIKPSNLIRSPTGRIVLIDFDSACDAQDSSAPLLGGTLGYAPPEQENSQKLTPKVDIYALGITLCELLTGIAQREGLTYLKNRALLPPSIGELLEHMTAPHPTDRPEITEVAQHLCKAWATISTK